MTPEAQRIAIAEVCGYKLTPLHQNTFQLTWQLDGSGITGRLPDYLNDLNAMHEAEKALDPLGKSMTYLNELEIVTETYCATSQQWRFVTASAAQRAEAFLKALNLYA